MMSKKDMLTLGVLAIGGVAVASTFASSGDTGSLEGKKGRAGGILGSQQGYGAAPIIYNLPAAAPVTFPAPPSFGTADWFATSPVHTQNSKKASVEQTPVIYPNRGAAGVSSAGKKEVIYGGYKPSGKTYVFGGKAFETQAVKEIVAGGYSPTLSQAFGISPDIASGGSKKTATTLTRAETSYQKSVAIAYGTKKENK